MPIPESRALTVKQLNFYVKSLIESNARLQSITVIGEISNFKNHYASGHLYFTLKDETAAIKCVMFRAYALRMKLKPQDGDRVILTGRVSLYEKDGQYQFYAEEMQAYGTGDISAEFERIKAKLDSEGLFDKENKRPLPAFPKTIAVVTSGTGAAVQDIFNILSRRWPLCRVILCPVSVQGASAVPEMLNALDRLYSLSAADVIIIGRGGGSAEDLSAFNDESLARKIYESPVPVISAVGHETDFSISDFVADMRAPTPSAAAEIAVPDREEMLKVLDKLNTSIITSLNGKYNYSLVRFQKSALSPYFKNPYDTIFSKYELACDRLLDRLSTAYRLSVNNYSARLTAAVAALDSLSPLKVMSRGYSVASNNGKIIKKIDEVSNGDKIEIKLSDGKLLCTVNEKEKSNG